MTADHHVCAQLAAEASSLASFSLKFKKNKNSLNDNVMKYSCKLWRASAVAAERFRFPKIIGKLKKLSNLHTYDN